MDHFESIEKAIDYIEEHLDEELSLSAIAKVAAYSTWHFQRIFGAMVGESLADYIRKRRLSRALEELQKSQRRVVEIALDCHFESQEAFTRAFKAEFQLTPAKYRKLSAGKMPPFVLPKVEVTRAYVEHLYKGVTMEPKIIQVPSMTIIGMETAFISVLSKEKNNMEKIPQLWGAFEARVHEIGDRVQKRSLGLCQAILDERKTREDEFLYTACVEVKVGTKAPLGMLAKTIPGGTYAAFIHKGSLENLQHTYGFIFGSWLPNSGKQLRRAPDVEVYDERFKLNAPDSEFEIWIPVET